MSDKLDLAALRARIDDVQRERGAGLTPGLVAALGALGDTVYAMWPALLAAAAERDALRAELTMRRQQVDELSEDMGAVELRAERAEAEVERMMEAAQALAAAYGAHTSKRGAAWFSTLPQEGHGDVWAKMLAALAPRAAAKEEAKP